MSTLFEDALKKARQHKKLEQQDIVALLMANEVQSEQLFLYATAIRKEAIGDRVNLRAIIEFSNYCRQNCFYCGLRKDNTHCQRYRLTEEEIKETASAAISAGYKTIVLQCGEDGGYDKETIARLTQFIRNQEAAVTLSCGEWDENTYSLWKKAGANRYLMKQETADEKLYATLRPGRTLKERLHSHDLLRELGYQVGSGCMVGLPGQNYDVLAQDLILMRDRDIDMSGIGPFIPHPETPLNKAVHGDPLLTCRMVAIARIMMPLCMLPATTSLATLHPHGRELALHAGADVIMPNVSPLRTRKYYEIYPGKVSSEKSIAENRKDTIKLVESCGRFVSNDIGHSPKKEWH